MARALFLTCGIVHHNLALFKAPADAQPLQRGQIGLNHFAFKVESYSALQEAHKRLVATNATIDHIVDHGMTRSVYFLDRMASKWSCSAIPSIPKPRA